MRKIIIMMVAVIIVSGCTSLPSQNGDNTGTKESAGELEVLQSSFTEQQIYENSETSFILRVSNSNTVPLKDFEAWLSNTGPRNSVSARVIGEGACSDRCACEYSLIEPRDVSPVKLCQWDISVGDLPSGVSQTSYPVTVNMEYMTNLTTRDPIKVVGREEVAPKSELVKTYSFTNGIMDVSLSLPEGVRADSEKRTITADITISNVGPGSIKKENGMKSVDLFYSGSFTDIFEPVNCREVEFFESEKTTHITCRFEEKDSSSIQEATSYSLDMNVQYSYSRLSDTGLSVVSDTE
ncbi:MAG: hypothetical protein MUP63_00700 [Candidatus Nanohaloarchaeota archaeon QJJ-7]|nr:hypothetical protein [Candidatus Nanohaloarchaeota archaeon QJJ-7]